MTTFNQLFSQQYDELFPAGQEEMAFVKSLLGNAPYILDIGCGTGNKTELLARERKAMAFDLSPEMIDIANRRHAGPNLTYMTMNMTDLDKTFSPGIFDAAVCLGNTMAFLSGPGEFAAFLRHVRAVLGRKGVFVGQALNYDRIVKHGVSVLPPLETERVAFRRGYERRDDGLHFVIDMRDKKTGQEYREDSVMNPLTRSLLDTQLNAAGFGLTDFFGGYGGEPFTEESYHLIFKTVPL